MTTDHQVRRYKHQFQPLEILRDSIRKAKGVGDLPPSEDPYVMARLMKGAGKVLESFLGIRSKRSGAIEGGAVHFASRELVDGSKSLKAIFC